METKKKSAVIDAYQIWRIIAKDKKMVILFVAFAALFGVVVAFSIPKEYKSKVMLAPESASGSNFTSNISSLASMVGMDLSFGSDNDAIYPEIYPDLMGSMEFLFQLFPIKVQSKDGKINTTLYEYEKKYQKSPLWNYPKEQLSNWIKNLKPQEGKPQKSNYFAPTKEEYDIADAISKSISCQVDKKTSVITIEVSAQDPLIAATLTDSVEAKLKTFITQYRTNKARKDLAYVEKLHQEAKAQYTKARQQYASFADANTEIILESYRSKQEDLENEMQLQYNIYTQVVQQLQLSRAKVQEKTPVFTVLQTPYVPIKHSNKPKILIMIQFMILGFVIRAGYILFKHKDEILNNNNNQVME